MVNGLDRHISLAARFADFYEEVARIKLAIRDGRLPIYLGDGKRTLSTSGNDLAAMVSQRLKFRLQQQGRDVKDTCTEAEIEAYHVAQYVMAAVVDELFILEVDWPGSNAWQECLVERALYGSGNAGRNFFVHLDELLSSRAQNPIQDELAAVFLIALQLGFKGQHRGSHGAAMLRTYRVKLIQFLGAGRTNSGRQHNFEQAYQHTVSEPRDGRLAPLSRWYRYAALGLLIYVVISTVLWVATIGRFGEALSGG